MSTPTNSVATALPVYAISPGYRKVTLWVPKDNSQERGVTVTVTPHKGLSREKKYAAICEALTQWKVTPPTYQSVVNKAGLSRPPTV